MNDGGPAFPTRRDQPFGDGLLASGGMSLRDWFAGQALAGNTAYPNTRDMEIEGWARQAYKFADAMLAERERIMTTETHSCTSCGASFEWQVIEGFAIAAPSLCDDCLSEKERKELARKERRDKRARRERYEILCPDEFHQMDMRRFPRSVSPGNRRRVLNWKVNGAGVGLYLYGDTGQGNTRLVWRLLHRLYVDEGRDFLGKSAAGLQEWINAGWDDGTHHRKIAHANCVPVLFLDDIGKEAQTPRWETDLFEIIRTRTEHRRPMLLTSNFRVDGLVRRYRDKVIAGALVRRLEEFTEMVEL